MITDKDRSWWFGASDTTQIVGNWETKTFKKWWLEKLGLSKNNFTNKAMRVGTNYEHKILDTIPNVTKDRQIKIPELHLRVNLDGETEDTVCEVKTHKGEFKLTKAYRLQVMVQMYVTGKKGKIVAYNVTEDDYMNYFNEIDKERITEHTIGYDVEFIENDYLPKLKYLCECLEAGKMPRKWFMEMFGKNYL